MNLWLNYIRVETAEELDMLENTQVPDNEKTADNALIKEREMRQRELEMEMLQHDKTSALGHAERKGIEKGRAEMLEKMRRYGLTEEKIESILNA